MGPLRARPAAVRAPGGVTGRRTAGVAPAALLEYHLLPCLLEGIERIKVNKAKRNAHEAELTPWWMAWASGPSGRAGRCARPRRGSAALLSTRAVYPCSSVVCKVSFNL
jgi:hypothetical protein